MKKFFLIAAIALIAGAASAQEPDLEAIAAMKIVKADSLSMMLGKVFGTQAAMNNTSTNDRAKVLQAFGDEMNMDQQDEQYREGNSLATEFFKVAGDMKIRSGIEMNSASYAEAFLARFNDTTAVVNINAEVQSTNAEAKRIIEELKTMLQDSAKLAQNASLIALKNDSLSRNMGRFYGMQMNEMSKRKKLTDEQKARLIEGFKKGIVIDEDKSVIAGKTMGNDYLNLAQSIKKQLHLNLSKKIFVNTVNAILNDPKVPTVDEFKALDTQAQAYMKEVQEFTQANSAEALTHRTMGAKYIENIMEKDPSYVQTPSGLVYKMINPGNGKKFAANDKIRVMYKGTHVDGKTFDESKEPIAFAPSQVVPGFREALLMMSPGAKMIAVLPYNLAYGSRGAGQSIKPYETLVFEIETLGIDSEEPKKEVKPIENKDLGKALDNVEKDVKEAQAELGKAANPVKSTSTKKKTTKKASKRKK